MPTFNPDLQPECERLVRATGERVTRARVAVIGVLLSARQALSHQEVEAHLAGQHIDRVTVYRVLDWLVEAGLAHRIVAADRTWRFMADRKRHGNHAHFLCNACGKMLCLDQPPAARMGLPRGFRSQSIELTVRGLCASCPS